MAKPSEIDDPAARSGGPREMGNRKNPRIAGCGVALAILAVCGIVLVLLGVPGKVKRGLLEVIEKSKEVPEPVEVEKVVEVEVEKIKVVEKEVKVEVPVPPDMPDRFVPYKRTDVAELFNGIQIRSELVSEQGEIASVEREADKAFEATFELKVRVPKPSGTLADLAEVNSHLPRALPGLGPMVEAGNVSKFYHHLYELKQRQVQANLTRLEKVLSRHNFYDCETVLELSHPDSGQKVFFIQGEMDVVSDGSDGDRMPVLDDSISGSQHFQPTTSYGWPKTTRQPNPMIELMEKKLAEHKERYKVKGLTRSENRYLEDQIKTIPRVVTDLKSRSFLIAEADPFIVIPLSLRPYMKSNAYIPSVGDYAVVVHEDKLYPAIVGDYGPTTKVGEASLRMAKQINERSSPYRRPVSDLTVSYLIFPKTADKPFSAPDLAKWQSKCQELLDRIGGVGEGYALHEWSDPFAEEPGEGGGGVR